MKSFQRCTLQVLGKVSETPVMTLIYPSRDILTVKEKKQRLNGGKKWVSFRTIAKDKLSQYRNRLNSKNIMGKWEFIAWKFGGVQ